MSKIGKKPIIIPEGVEVIIDNQLIKVKSAKGELSFSFLDCVSVKKEENQIIVDIIDQEKKNIWGLTRTLISNMIEGVTHGFEKKLLVIGVGFNAKLEGNKLLLSLGFSHKVNFEIPKNMKVAIEQDPKGNYIIILNSIDKQQLGEIAANLRSLKKPEPYKGKGIRYFDEVIKLKAGKSAKK